jgi:TRAP-type C4-dicarboxylate transport system permease small subunit
MKLALIIGGVWVGLAVLAVAWHHVARRRDRAEEAAFKEREAGR